MQNSNSVSNKLIELRVFCTQALPGSPQFIHFFPKREQMNSAFGSYTVMDEYDHSFVYFESPEYAIVKWKNRAGPVQFCGSGAYGLSWFYYQNFSQKVLQIKSELISDITTSGTDNVVMTFPAMETKHLLTRNGAMLFNDADSGIFLLRTNMPIESNDMQWILSYIAEQRLTDIHGFCVFSWDQQGSAGNVRYFAPWHGRNEDYVTGSIHRYLTPLIYDLFSARNQIWTQVSSSGGRLLSHCNGSEVSLSGQCRIHAVS